ncbi:MAG: FAD-binding oxidoreductase [Gammaproteobacteria bacterium]|nr:FAD-binding oxidoreductase [Gammaproteobacteria bacterium]
MQQLTEALADIVGEKNVLVGDDVTSRNPGWCRTSLDAGLLVRPGTKEEVSRIAALAHAHDLVVVPHGGVTGLVQGTSSQQRNIIISFERMNKVVRVDPAQGILIAEAGVKLQDAHTAAAEFGMTLGVDIPSRGSCTIGGIVSTNAGGVRVIRYGMTRENLLGLDVVLADGTVLEASNTLMKNNAGFDLKQLFIGSEGTLGLVTQAVFKLFPKPLDESTALIAANSVDDLIKLLTRARQELGSKLLSFEAMWHAYYWGVTGNSPNVTRPIDDEYPVYAILEAGEWSGAREVQLEEVLGKALEEGLIQDAVLASSLAERQAIWLIREDTDPVQHLTDQILSFDIGFELRDIEPFVASLTEAMAERWPDKPLYIFGHMGDGNLHIILGLSNEEYADKKAFSDVIYREVGRYPNSTVSAEHGIGLEKRDYLHYSRSEEQRTLMQKLMQALDPGAMLNPGKIV